jgi:hypothetical protein
VVDTTTTLTWLLRDQVSGTAKRINGQLDQLGLKATKGTGPMGRLSKATGGLITPMNLLLAAGVGVVGVLGNMIEGAIEDEKVNAKLLASLKANVKGFDGSTDAIDRYIDKQTDLGFMDEQVADSLAQLVTATGDVTEAQTFQAAAMDLARLKGVDLATATDALTKIEGGSFRILKSLGIELDKGATKTDALAAVQAAAAGQATAFANTTSGAMAKITAKIDAAKDKIGAFLLPVFEAIVSFLADDFIPWIGTVADAIKPATDAVGGFLSNVLAGIRAFQHLASLTSSKKRVMETISGYQGAMQPSPSTRGYAEGGWVGLRGPELAMVGERGPEYIVPNGGGTGIGAHTHPIVIDGRELWGTMTGHAYAELSRLGTGSAR